MEKKSCLNTFFARMPIGIVVLFSVGIVLSAAPASYAATGEENTSFGIANYLPIKDKQVTDGDIVSFSPNTGYVLTKKPYDNTIVGVVTLSPAISLETITGNETYPVVSTGDTYINVTTMNGSIKKGDPITTSTIPGKGMKATKTGYIVGVALEGYTNSNMHAVKKISSTLDVNYYVSNASVHSSVFDVLNLSALATYEEPLNVFKYFIASLVVVLSFIFGFFSFARTANKGLEALGRNPLASRMIQIGIVLNIVVAIIIILSGLAVAFFVIRL